ncbi:hypothetical protein [Brachybacterium sp. UMB0905]|uniref:hypothetical protein n=1 Tax=Brachybacterium sp. UMB0905 TaxID=2069310 RepID=UPI0011AF1467|nr:hypothetical protein [Brachybacterium sp. UMB0905]
MLGLALGTLPASMASAEGIGRSLESSLKAALADRATKIGVPLEAIEDLSYEPTPEVLGEYAANPQECVAGIAELILPDECDQCSKPTNSAAPTGPIASPTGTATYNAKVFAGVPAGGICQIRQDFRATVTNYRVSGVKILGSSYVVGVCLFQWSPNRQWHSISGRTFNLRMKGTFSAVIKGGPITFSATFLAIYDIQRSGLKQHFQ